MSTQETVQGREMLTCASKRQKAMKKFEQKVFLKSLLRASVGILEECTISKTGYNSRPIFGTERLGFNRWNCKFCSRDFSSFKNKSKNTLLRHKIFDWIHEQSRKQFLKRSFITRCKLPLSNKPAMLICYSMASPSSWLSSRQAYLFIKKYFLSSLSYQHESISLLRSVLHPKVIEKLSFSKICHEKDAQSLPDVQYPEKLSAPSSKYLKRLKYLLKRKLSSPELCKQHFSHPTFYPSCSYLFAQDVSKSIQEAPRKLPKSQRNKTHKTSVYRGPCYPIFLHKVRGFHSSLFPFAKSDSNKPSTDMKRNKSKSTEVKKTDECDQPCKEKNDVYRQEKVKCDKPQLNKEKAREKPGTKKKIVASACKKTCLPIGKCELPHTVPPSKMEYKKVICPPPKFIKPKPCPPVLEQDDESHIEIKQMNIRTKQICASPPLPKPPHPPIVLCPCPPPRKLHPGPCPSYETKVIAKRSSIQPCKLKEKYPCPTGVYYCPPQKKPCKLKQENDCKYRKERKAPAS